MTDPAIIHQSQPSQCFDCMDRGILLDKVFYTFCDLLGQRYCTCAAGETTFRQWCQTKEVRDAITRKRAKEIAQALKFSALPKRWQEKTMEHMQGQEELKQKINVYLDGFLEFQKQGRGVYLWSNGAGTGKTHMLSAICHVLIERYAVPCVFVTEEQLFIKLREAFDNPQISERSRFRKFSEIPVLLIDDFGAAKPTGWKNEVMTSLLDYRLNHLLPTCFTSNYHPEDYQHFLKTSLPLTRPERIPSRIYELCRQFIIEVTGDDWRKK